MDELSDFDKPVFKQLSANDSGDSKSNQAGVVIPQALDAYFPQLMSLVSPSNPAPGENITAILVVDDKEVDVVQTRYQLQSWGGERSPERRITGNLAPLRNQSKENDVLLIERNIADRSLYRLTLIRKGTPAFAAIFAKAKTRWGPVDPVDPPVKEAEFQAAEQEQIEHEQKPLDLFDNDAVVSETKTKKVARGRAFQKLTTDYYAGKCAVCGMGFVSVTGRTEVEAAHIVPRGKKGADDARNGLSLCRSHHWAFDRGLWGVGADGKIIIPAAVLKAVANQPLKPFEGKTLTPPSKASMAPDAKALEWHRKHVVKV